MLHKHTFLTLHTTHTRDLLRVKSFFTLAVLFASAIFRLTAAAHTCLGFCFPRDEASRLDSTLWVGLSQSLLFQRPICKHEEAIFLRLRIILWIANCFI